MKVGFTLKWTNCTSYRMPSLLSLAASGLNLNVVVQQWVQNSKITGQILAHGFSLCPTLPNMGYWFVAFFFFFFFERLWLKTPLSSDILHYNSLS